MTSPAITIRDATTRDGNQLITLFAEAFLRSPVGDWLIPDIDTRYAVYCDYFAIFIEHGLAHGVVHTTDAISGATVWRPHTSPPPADYDQRLAEACGPWLLRFQQLDHAFGHYHPQEPHHHLAFVAVHPDVQNYGIGSALIQHHHTHLDAHGIAAYLEASNTNNHRLYPRHRYADLGEPFHLPGGGPPIWPMWRQSGPALQTT